LERGFAGDARVFRLSVDELERCWRAIGAINSSGDTTVSAHGVVSTPSDQATCSLAAS
jgi:hypothetical protein